MQDDMPENTVMNPDNLERFRSDIDRIDCQILELLAERMRAAREIGAYKKEHHLTALQPSRWSEVLEDRINKGTHLGLRKDMIQGLYELIHLDSLKLQEDVMHEPGRPGGGSSPAEQDL